MKANSLKFCLNASAIAAGITTFFGTITILAGKLELPSIFHSILDVVAAPLVFTGGLVTYFLIVGDNWNPITDFVKYALPISIVLNSVIGFFIGWLYFRFTSWYRSFDQKY